MPIIFTNRSKQVDDPWDLYITHPSFYQATAAIERAWSEAILLAPEQPAQERARLAEKHVYAVMEKWSDVGACDTEPCCVLRDRVRKHFGCYGGWI